VVGVVHRGDRQPQPGAEQRTGARRLQHVGRTALFGDRLIGGRGHHDHVVPVGVLDRFAQLRRGGRGAFGPKAHVDRLRTVVGRVDDRLHLAAFGEVAFLDQEATVIPSPHHADAVVARRARDPRHGGAVSVVIDGCRAFAGFAVDVVGVRDLAGQVRLGGVHAGVDHRHQGTVAVRDAPRLRQVLTQRPPLDRRARGGPGRRLGGAQRGIVRKPLQQHVAGGSAERKRSHGRRSS
jgi:hypothetical protein